MKTNWISFLFGYIAGFFTYLIVAGIRIILPRLKVSFKTRVKAAQQGISINVGDRFRHDIVQRVQKLHLASPLFSLDEILVTPLLIAPPPPPTPDSIIREAESDRLQIPYLPDWPELNTANFTPVLTFAEALHGGANLLLMGRPGSGKTVALSYLATRVANRSEELGELRQYLPIYIHTNDINLPTKTPYEPVDILVDALLDQVATITSTRLPSLIREALEHRNALLLFDGMDELNPERLAPMVDFLGVLLKQYPALRMVVAISTDYYDGLIALGLAPVSLCAWSEREKETFVNHWGDLWKRFVIRDIQNSSEEIDPLLLNNWILGNDTISSPLEFTLKTWSAYAGDVLGPTNTHAIESYLLRMTGNIPKARSALEKMAGQMILNMSLAITAREAAKWLPDAETRPGEQVTTQGEQQDSAALPSSPEQNLETIPTGSTTENKPASPEGLSIQRVLPDLLDNGLLLACRGSRLTFIHPIIAGYLASAVMGSPAVLERLNNQANWIGKFLSFYYLAPKTDLTSIVTPMVEDIDDPLFRKLLSAGYWLRDSTTSARWRPIVLRQLATNLQKEQLSLGLRARILTALVNSHDPGVMTLLRQLLTHRFDNYRLLAVIGCGLARDIKVIKDLIGMLGDPSAKVGQAALYALANIKTKECLDAIASVLLSGTEEMRRTAAETLAFLPEEGYPALKEGSTVEDLLVRRAVVFGLQRVNQPWARLLLEKMEIEDGQWVVRSAATQALEEIRNPNPRIPQPLTPLTDTPWLIEFAAKLGVGVTRGRAALNLVTQALKADDPLHRRYALYTLTRRGDQSSVPQIYQILYGDLGEEREAAFNTIWHLGAGGIELPSPIQFGLG